MIRIITVGKIKDKNLSNLIDDYQKRISKYTKIEIIELKDFNENNDALNKESELILKNLDNKDFNILLDRLGKEINSIELSQMIDQKFINHSRITFIIGGSLGVNEEVEKYVNYKLSFSKFTFPHQLFRLILLEQIYRSFKILNNERYHK